MYRNHVLYAYVRQYDAERIYKSCEDFRILEREILVRSN